MICWYDDINKDFEEINTQYGCMILLKRLANILHVRTRAKTI